MSEVSINLWAVLAAGIASTVIGGLWYSSLLFAKKWTEHMKVAPGELEAMKEIGPRSMGIAFILALLQAYIFAHFISYIPATNAVEGAQAGFWIWLGFVLTIGASTVLFERVPLPRFAINAGYRLVELLAMGIILATWL